LRWEKGDAMPMIGIYSLSLLEKELIILDRNREHCIILFPRRWR